MKSKNSALSLSLAMALVGCSNQENAPGDPAPNADPDTTACPSQGLGTMGTLPEGSATQRNQSGSMGARQYHRMFVTVDDAAPIDILRVELWDDFGVFTGGDATAGTFTIRD